MAKNIELQYVGKNKRKKKNLLGPEIVQITADQIRLIKKRLKAAQDRQKSYANPKHGDMIFNMGDKVFFKVSPWKDILWFGKQRKLSPKYTEPYEITERIRLVAYRLALPSELSQIHNIFYFFMLWKYISNLSHILQSRIVELKENLTYLKEPVQILSREKK